MSASMRGGTDIETGDLVLVGDAEAFGTFSRCLRDGQPTTVELEPVSGWRTIRPISLLHVSPSRHGAIVRIDDHEAFLSGNHESLQRLADEVDLFVGNNDLNEPGVHAHLESTSWSTGVALFEPESRGLILAGPVADSW